jgi:hypothetical protein
MTRIPALANTLLISTRLGDKVRFWYCGHRRHIHFRRLWAIYGSETEDGCARVRQSDVESLSNPREFELVWPLQLTVQTTPFDDFTHSSSTCIRPVV